MFDFSTFSYGDDGFRTCDVTGLHIHRSAEDMVKLYGISAVVALAIGGIAAFFVPMTRWEAIGLLGPQPFYTDLSLHAWYLLIFWMVFIEVAILYVGGPFVLGRRLPLKRLSQAAWGVMVAGVVLVTVGILTATPPNAAPMDTSYPPLPSPAVFYLGAIVFLLGTTLAAVPFLVTIWQEKREHPNDSLPLVTFGAFIASIVALESLVGGLMAYVPTFLWRIGWLPTMDPALYRQWWWILGHGTQQINLIAMITVWYFMTHVVGGAEVASEKVSRTAFVLYLFFINLGAAHHLMADPASGVAWKMWNTSYAMYGAVFASMIHAFAIPAGLELGRRRKGLGGGTFGWLWSGPWRDPGFSATILSIILFGFLGGITGVMMGQMQLNLTWHNTFAVPGHFHGTVALGTTLAFMGLGYYLLRLVFGRNWVGGRLATIQPYLYGGAMGVVVLMMMYLGVLFGIPRRDPQVMHIPGTTWSFATPTTQFLFAVYGIAAIFAVLGGALFVGIVVVSLLRGATFTSDMMPLDRSVAADGGAGEALASAARGVRGTFVFVLVFMATFVVLYALNWFLLAQVWQIGP